MQQLQQHEELIHHGLYRFDTLQSKIARLYRVKKLLKKYRQLFIEQRGEKRTIGDALVNLTPALVR